MGDGSLTFVVPVRDPRGVRNWSRMMELMAATFDSLSRAQGRVVVSATRGTQLPALPPGARLVEVDRPYVPLPEGEGPARYAAVRRDKGARIIAGLVAEQPRGHVMVVDYDDFVSSRLAELPAADPDSVGWFVDSGFLFDGGRLVLKHPSNFDRMCGTSLIVRADLLRIPDTLPDVDETFVDRALGSHIFLKNDLAAVGTPMRPVPFPGAVYRIGYSDSTSPPKAILTAYLSPGRMLRRPKQWARNVRLLRLTSSIRGEFGLPN